MLEQRRAKEKGYITLKEAAQVSGYTSDYVGQLIRAGKIKGEQVYSGVAWMTTKEELDSYRQHKNRFAKSVPTTVDLTTNSSKIDNINNLSKLLHAGFNRVRVVFLVCLLVFVLVAVKMAISSNPSIFTTNSDPLAAEVNFLNYYE